HTPLPLPGRKLAVIADEANAQQCAKGTFHTFVLDVRAPENPVPISTLPTPRDRDYCSLGTFGPHNLHENRPGSMQSEEVIFATYNNAGVRIFDIKDQFAPKEIAYWVPPIPAKLVDPRPNIALDAKTADLFVTTEGLIFVSACRQPIRFATLAVGGKVRRLAVGVQCRLVAIDLVKQEELRITGRPVQTIDQAPGLGLQYGCGLLGEQRGECVALAFRGVNPRHHRECTRHGSTLLWKADAG